MNKDYYIKLLPRPIAGLRKQLCGEKEVENVRGRKQGKDGIKHPLLVILLCEVRF